MFAPQLCTMSHRSSSLSHCWASTCSGLDFSSAVELFAYAPKIYALAIMIKPEINLHLLSCSNLLSLIVKPHRKHLRVPLTYGFGEEKGLPLLVDTEKPEASQHPACQTKLGKCAWYTNRLTLSRPVLRWMKKSCFWLNFTPLRRGEIIKALSVQVEGMTSMGSLCVWMENSEQKTADQREAVHVHESLPRTNKLWRLVMPWDLRELTNSGQQELAKCIQGHQCNSSL